MSPDGTRMRRATIWRLLSSSPPPLPSPASTESSGRGGGISGRVTSGGTPVMGASVTIFDPSRPDWSETAQTDVDGRYLVDRLPSAGYQVFFDGAPRTLGGLGYPQSLGREGAGVVAVGDADLVGRDRRRVAARREHLRQHRPGCAGAGPRSQRGAVGIDDRCRRHLLRARTAERPLQGQQARWSRLSSWYNNKPTPEGADTVPVTAPYAALGVDLAPYAGGNEPPVLDSIGDKGAPARTSREFAVSGSDPEGGTLTFSAQGLPAGAVFDAGARVFSWRPSPYQIGIHRITFRVDDDGSPPLSDFETVAMRVAVDNGPPRLVEIPDETVTEGQDLSFSLSGVDGEGGAVSYSAAGLPAWAGLDPTTGAFSWRPRFDQQGKHAVTFRVSDDALPPLSSGETVFLRVLNPAGPIFSDGFGHVGSTDRHWQVLDGFLVTRWRLLRFPPCGRRRTWLRIPLLRDGGRSHSRRASSRRA